MDEPLIRPLREQDIREFYKDGLPRACRGWAVEYRGQVACIVGVTIMPTLMLAWSDVKPDVRASKRLIFETAKKLMINIEGLGYPVIYAVANPDILTALGFLTRLGWEHIETSARGEVFRWVKQSPKLPQ